MPSTFWPLLLGAAGPHRVALVGGAVRDWLLHNKHRHPWRGLVDLDLLVEDSSLRGTPAGSVGANGPSPARGLVEQLSLARPGHRVLVARCHGQFGTVEVELEMNPRDPVRLLLDVASARAETYPVPAENPVVCFGGLEDDLARRDLTINAMAVDLATDTLFDPHGGRADLEARRLRFLHPSSLRDDPTRLVRAARYAARLGFRLEEGSRLQAACTLTSWPWRWHPGDPPEEAPPALSTRLRRELELLLERENWRLALMWLQEWGGLLLLDPQLQADRQWARRLHWATKLSLPLSVALIVVAKEPLALAERLQVPYHQHQLLQQFEELRRRLAAAELLPEGQVPSTAGQWCQALESPPLSPSAVALALASGVGPRRPMLRWYLRWRHLGPEESARELMAAGVPEGPELGEQLRRSRQRRLQQERL